MTGGQDMRDAAQADGAILRLPVQSAAGGYEVVIGEGLLARADAFVSAVVETSAPLLIVADEAVAAAGYAPALEQALRRAFASVRTVAVPSGEPTKSFAQATRLYAECIRSGLDRHSAILALGGGVAGDLAGFVAATYMRGVRFIQVPTTLLAHDASIGGKVAVNLPEGKNLVGAFHPPRLVLYDVLTLRTLPGRERACGLAEAVKHGVIRDPELFLFIERHAEALLAGDSGLLAELLHRSCAVKAAVVSADEREEGLRAILNFGHTVGHAIEALAAYGAYTHGEAVALGMVAEARLARRLGILDRAAQERLQALLPRAGLPVRLPDELRQPAAIDRLVEFMRRDKKAERRSLAFVLPRSIGAAEIMKSVGEDDVRRALLAQD